MGETRPIHVHPWLDWCRLPRTERCQHIVWANNCTGNRETADRIRELAKVAEHVQAAYLAAVEASGTYVGDVTDTIIRAVVMAVELGVQKADATAWCMDTLQRRLCKVVEWAAADHRWQATGQRNALSDWSGKLLWGAEWGATNKTGPWGTEHRLAESLGKTRAWVDEQEGRSNITVVHLASGLSGDA